MNILSDFTRHLVMASRNIKTQPKMLITKQSIDLPSFSTPHPLENIQAVQQFMPSLPIQRPELKPSLESLTFSHSSMDLGKISDLVSDNSVSMIVCDGPMKLIKIKKDGKLETTSISLDKQDIDSIINAFSKKSSVQIRPVFRSKVENLSILGLVSPLETRFMLSKEI